MKIIAKRRNKRTTPKDIVVIYHKDCTDGFSAAWAAWKNFGDSAEYVGIDPDEHSPTELVNKELYMIDLICGDDLPELLKNNKKVVAIDHHVTNQEIVKLVPDRLFDINHSAAVLAWKYFHGSKKVPRLLNYVEDVDLWNLKMPDTNEISAAMDMLDFSFGNWSRLAVDFENESKFKEYVSRGKIILEYQDKLIERLTTNNLELVELSGYKVYVVNSPNFSSQIGNILAKKTNSLGIVWYENSDGSVHVSLRSVGDVDVSKIAKRFGGGGHKHAAGFRIENCSKLPWKKL